MSEKQPHEQTFWEHLDELRKVIFMSLAVVAVFAAAAFACREQLFDILLAPSKSDFITYRFFCALGQKISLDICPADFSVQLINTQLAAQFTIHLNMSFWAGILLAFPYIVYRFFRFISPALYQNERKYSGSVIFFSVLLFLIGILLNYFLIFPLSFRFLATYQAAESIPNMITLSSYIDTLSMLSLMIGLTTELPIVAWFLSKIGLLTDKFMRLYRRHITVALLTLSAIITPTADVFTLLLVFCPLYLLYEISILIVKKVCRKKVLSEQRNRGERLYCHR
jgi:sec-independent protein translocase protein TatC